MKVLTAQQMRDNDRRAIDEVGIPGTVLMENAGAAVVDFLARQYNPLAGQRIAIFCGSGNNGGDGFVIARRLHLLGAKPSVFTVGDMNTLKPDARAHWQVLLKINEKRKLPIYAAGTSDADNSTMHGFDLIVDALLGTGIKEAPRPDYAAAIENINEAGLPVVAVDIPSGINADTGAVAGAAVRATHTVTFAYPKIGLFLPPGSDYVGTLHVADIGFDWEMLETETDCRLYLPALFVPLTEKPATKNEHIQSEAECAPFGRSWSEGRARITLPRSYSHSSSISTLISSPARNAPTTRLLKKRAPDANKGDYGHVGVVAGSRGMAGAPALVARAAQHSGAGLVTVLTAASAQPIVAAKLDEQMTLPLTEDDGAISEDAYDAIAAFALKAAVLCIGPGLTTKPHTVSLIQRLIAEIEKPIVLDADGLNALAMNPAVIERRTTDPRCPLVLTPHPGEAARLLGTTTADVQSNRIKSVQELARKYRAVVLLKGRYTLVCDPNGSILINTTGNPGMATGGSGDTLTGIIGGLLALYFAKPHATNHPDPNSKKSDSNSDQSKTSISNSSDLQRDTAEVVALGAYIHGLAGDLAAADNGETGLVAGDIIAHLTRALRQLEEPE